MGYGTWRDKLTYGYHALSARLSDPELSNLFYTDDVAAKLVEKRPEEAFRKGYRLRDPADETGASKLFEQARALDVDAKMQEGATWGRLYGGSLVVLGIEGGGLPWQPLMLEKVREVRFVNVVDRRACNVEKYYTDPLSPKYGQPEVYGIAGENGLYSFIHESRVIRFDGTPVDMRKRRELNGWSYSVLQRPYDVMRAFATAFQAAGVLTADASQAVFTMKGLFEMIASGEKEKLQTRMQLVDMSRSAARAVILDSDGERFERIATNFQGLPEMLDRMMMRLASSVDMPVTILMGRSPAGQNATGESDFTHWYDSIRSQQAKEFGPKLLRVYEILAHKPLPGAKIEWCELQEMTEKEKAEIEKYEAEKWATYIDKGVLYPQEVALAKFGKESNGQVEIDEEQRKEELEAEKELALNPPPPVAPPGQMSNGGGPPSPSTSSSATAEAPSDDDEPSAT